MVKNETKNYQAPTIKVVKFVTEVGFGLYGVRTNNVITDFESEEPRPRNNNYIQTNDWGTFSEM